MAAQQKSGYRLTQEQYAYIYAVHPNTIHRWQNRQLPLDDPRKLLFIVSHHPSCPMTLKRKGDKLILADYAALSRG